MEARPDGRFEDTHALVSSDRGAGEWTSVRTEPERREFRVRGCDFCEFDADRIRTKKASRKQPVS